MFGATDIIFEREIVGAILLVVGIVLGIYGLQRYRTLRRNYSL
ncbi:DUF3185 family protein [Cohnella abietis]